MAFSLHLALLFLSYMHTYARRTSPSYQICSLRTRFPLAELLALRFLGPDKHFVDAAAIHVDDLKDKTIDGEGVADGGDAAHVGKDHAGEGFVFAALLVGARWHADFLADQLLVNHGIDEPASVFALHESAIFGLIVF